MVFIDIYEVFIKKCFWGCDKRCDSKLYAKKIKKNGGERARERHFIRPLARPLVGELVLAARSIGARERRARSALASGMWILMLHRHSPRINKKRKSISASEFFQRTCAK